MSSYPLQALTAPTIFAGAQPYTYPIKNVRQGSILKIINDTQFDIAMSRPSGGRDTISAGEVNTYSLNNNDVNLYLTLTKNPQVANITNTLIGFILYDPETPPTGVYPIFLARFGNPVVSSINISGLHNWIIAVDPTGNLYLQDTNTGAIVYIQQYLVSGQSMFTFGDIIGGSPTVGQSYITYLGPSSNALIITTPQIGAANGMAFNVWNGSAGFGVLGLGNVSGAIQIDNAGHLLAVGTVGPSLGALQTGISTQSISGSDTTGTIHLKTTAAPPGAGSTVALITFGTPYSATPNIFVSTVFGNQFAITGGTTSGWNLVILSGLSANTDYFIQYFVIQV